MSESSPGARLKKLRLEKGLSLEEVHKRTKIHLNILKSIEEDNLINFNPVYIRGFLKIYCNFLGVNPADFVPDYRETRTVVQLGNKKEKSPQVSFIKSASSKLGSFRPRIKLKTILIIIAAIAGVFLLFKAGKWISSRRHDSSKPVAAIQEKPVAAQPVSKAKSKSEKTKKAEPQLPSIIRLSIRARENCLVQLRADGKVLFHGILKKGRFESWQAKEKMELSLGNAGVVDLEVNGKLISSIGRKGQSIKNIQITKEGLNIAR